MAKKKGSRSNRTRDYREALEVRSFRQMDRYETPRRALDPRDLPGLAFSRAHLDQLTRPTPRFEPVQFQGPPPGNPRSRKVAPGRVMAQATLSPASAPTHRPGGAARAPGRVVRPNATPQGALSRSISVESRDVQATRLHGPSHSLSNVRDLPSCKSRPDNTKKTRGSGAQRREFIPWCDRKS